MIFTLFKRIFREHSGAHLWVPIVVTAILSVAKNLLSGGTFDWRPWDWPGLWLPWFRDHWLELLGIYLAFAVVVWESIRRASDVRWTMIGDLTDTLNGASRYFAIGTISLKEWFEPNTAVYLATIVRQQRQERSFRHERVLLFYDEAGIEALQASYLDQHYARSFSAMHERFDIPLAYLKPDEIRHILAKLAPEQRWALAPVKFPQWFWRRALLRPWSKNTHLCRPFAVVYRGDEQIILRFSKSGNSLVVHRTTDPSEVEACMAFVGLIESAIYKSPADRELFERCRFAKYLCP